MVLFGCMGLSVVLRYALDDTNFAWARRMYSITIVLYCLRFMYVFYVNKNIGPKVIMIRRMVRARRCLFGFAFGMNCVSQLNWCVFAGY